MIVWTAKLYTYSNVNIPQTYEGGKRYDNVKKNNIFFIRITESKQLASAVGAINYDDNYYIFK